VSAAVAGYVDRFIPGPAVAWVQSGGEPRTTLDVAVAAGLAGTERILKALEQMTALPRIYFAVQRSTPSDPAVQVRVRPSLAVAVLPSKSLLQN
jgi:hypothetical protein